MDAFELETLLGTNIRKHRRALGFTQEQLAEHTGLSPSHISDIELGRTWISADVLSRIATRLLVAPWVLLFDQNDLSGETARDIIRNTDSSRRLSERIAARLNDIVAEEVRLLQKEQDPPKNGAP